MQLSEITRRGLRAVAPEGTYLRSATRYGDAVTILRMGFSDYLRLKRLSRAVPGTQDVLFWPPGLTHPVWVRPGTTDAMVFENNLVRRSYACASCREPVHLVMDAGANAGYASVYFLNVYRDAHVIALEPDPENAALARLNLAPYGARATLLETGIWPHRARLRLRPSERHDKVQVEEASEGEPYDCLGIDPLTVMTQAGYTWIDLFKCDIEGGEEQLFGRDPDRWLEKTRCIVAEIHSAAATRVVYTATARHGFRSRRYRDLHVFERSPRSGRLAW